MILLICFFAGVLVEVQFLGYKFGLKGSTYTRESTVYIYIYIYILVVIRYFFRFSEEHPTLLHTCSCVCVGGEG